MVGDVNSTLACSIVAKKLGIPVAHVEAGLRTGDLQNPFPEEANRVSAGQHMADHRQARNRVEHFRQIGFHPCALARGKHDNR